MAVEEIAEPAADDSALLVQGIGLGVCGTDRRLLSRVFRSHAGTDRLVVGHESLGRVLEAPPGSGWSPGDLVVGVVRKPDPGNCWFCRRGEWDLCETPDYAERGISGADGFGAERYRLDLAAAVHVGPSLGPLGILLEPASIVAKAWEEIDRRLRLRRDRALILGAGPIGQLAALFGAQRGYDVHVVDRIDGGPKPAQVAAIGGRYYTSVAGLRGTFDAVLECTGSLAADAIRLTASAGACCLIGAEDDADGERIALRRLVYEVMSLNKSLFGVGSSNLRHFDLASSSLAAAPASWLEGLLGPRVPLEDWQSAFGAPPSQIKAMIWLSGRDSALEAATGAGTAGAEPAAAAVPLMKGGPA